MEPDYFTDILKMNDLGITVARLCIIQFLVDTNMPFIELQQILKMSPGGINRTTLYRTLILFCSANLLYKIIDTRNKVYYGMGDRLKRHLHLTDLTNKENYHFQCIACGKIFCLPTKMHDVDLPPGFTKTNFSLLLSGKCSVCIKKGSKT